MRTWLGRLTVPIGFVGFTVGFFGLLRLAMFLWFVGPRATFWETVFMFLLGFRFDLLVALFFASPQLFLLGLLPERCLRWRAMQDSLQCLWFLGCVILPFVCICEWLFFEEFQTRLNYIAFEYLIYPTEVCCNIWESYPIVPLVTSVMGIGVGAFALIRHPFLRSMSSSLPWRRRLLVVSLYIVGTAGLWSTTNMDDMQISDNRLINECANTGLYSFVYYAWTCRIDFNQLYLTLDEHTAFETTRAAVLQSSDRSHRGSQNPLDRTVSSSRPRKDYNVVIILEESLGADFIGVLGDKRGLSPNFDQLAKKGRLFDNFYATGNRTARALEAVLTSLPPLPTEAILKRDHSDRVYTLANVLADRGYQRLFMTGGSGLFDGVRSFMTSNGFNQFLEQSDYDSPVFTNAWGVSDEDLFGRAIIEFDRLHAEGDPFFSVVLTVSNHRPYTIPSGRVALEDQSRTSAVMYADWALGKFFRQAQHRPFYKDTIFVVMGDHGARVYGSQIFPVKSYRVPLLIIHPEDKSHGHRSHALGCSMDIAPTILGLLGGSYRSTFFGRDLDRLGPGEGLALMQHNHDLALLDTSHNLTVIGVSKTAWRYRLEPQTYRLTPDNSPKSDALSKVIAYFQTAQRLYYTEQCFPDFNAP